MLLNDVTDHHSPTTPKPTWVCRVQFPHLFLNVKRNSAAGLVDMIPWCLICGFNFSMKMEYH